MLESRILRSFAALRRLRMTWGSSGQRGTWAGRGHDDRSSRPRPVVFNFQFSIHPGQLGGFAQCCHGLLGLPEMAPLMGGEDQKR
jgi:hypothetical protein